MDRLATDHYSKHYISDIEVVDRDPKGLPAPEVQNTLLSSHEERVQNHKNGGWQVLGVSEFNTSGSLRNLCKLAPQALGSAFEKIDRATGISSVANTSQANASVSTEPPCNWKDAGWMS